ncbi:hypothetical protein PR202_gb13628 [Eleusine coracana subsp. coracana]|uniref:CASP-like protein n=1 Tax=Eleusine coracana subsp. coracana TaxID=191504 RepID=A0AAV5ESH8_ELECO|nr:hypothetical protein QOZ80_9BG0717670 [Eleusine coracana subsp. coracana]GJN25757.1 hypothetical protein PR202_gb13628 [Eleusine coracana subsp. coracana]
MCEDEKSSGSSSKCANAISVAARIGGMGLAVASAALMATASQCTIYAAYGARPRTVTYSSYAPFVFLVVANAMAAFLSAIAVFLSVWKKGKDKVARILLPLIGAAVPALLYSSTGAAFAANGDLTYCSAYGKRVSVCAADAYGGGSSNFCSQVRVAIYLSLGAAIAVSVAEVLRSLPFMALGGGGSDSDSSSSSDSGGCDHGCHHKH